MAQLLGVFSDTVKRSRNSTRCPIYVVKGLQTNLMSLKTITALKLVHRVNSSTTGTNWKETYSQVFTGLGTMGDDYVIDNSAPYSPEMWLSKLELERMESMGVISKVEHPTDWCAGMVVVPKGVRICEPLNNNVLREPHPIPFRQSMMF